MKYFGTGKAILAHIWTILKRPKTRYAFPLLVESDSVEQVAHVNTLKTLHLITRASSNHSVLILLNCLSEIVPQISSQTTSTKVGWTVHRLLQLK